MTSGVGAQVAGYRLHRVIGEGGMAVVYLAERVSDGRAVAVKLLRDEHLDNDDFRRRFLRESRYATSLDHPNIVRVLESGEEGDDLYIAMQYVEGADLYALLERGALEPAIAIAVVAQVAAALDSAHAVGLLHRDVKPGNVLTTSGGEVRAARCYLTDFGLGKQPTKDSVALTVAGTFVGTLAYTAPEQIIGPAPGRAADLYSLGCVLYECLAGQPPFSGDEIEMMQAQVESDPPKLSKKRSPFPPEIDAVIKRAMAKEPERRHERCGELVEAAAAALGVPVPAVVPPVPSELDGALELVVAAGSAAGDRIRIDDELVIGREESGAGSLADDLEISRRHAVISRGPGGHLMVEDLGSRNGTFLNGRQTMGLEVLRPGDELELGATKLRVEASAAAARPALAASGERRVARLSVRLETGPAPAEARLRLGDEPVALELVHDGTRWRFAAS